jgi:ubiquinone/menaquinone biosynthesis C-methylase UbiE
MEDQEKIWDAIAPEWNVYKEIPSNKSTEFLKSCSGNVLDLGGGSGRHMIQIKKGKYYLLDISNEMIKLAREKAKNLKIDFEGVHSSMTEIPFSKDFFDFAICISSLHCIPGAENRLKAVEELYRVLKKNGTAYIGVWNFQSKRFKGKKDKEKMVSWTDKGKRYYYLFDKDEVHELFKSVGFEIVSEHDSEMMINFIVKKYSRV